MASKVLILPNFDGGDLPSEGLERYDRVYLITSQGNLPMNVVMQIMNLSKNGINIEFMQIDYANESELMFLLAFKSAQMTAQDPEIQITFVTDNMAFDHLVSAGKKSNIKLARAEGFSRISAIPSEPTEVQKPVNPTVVQKPAPKKVEPVAEPVPEPQPVVQQAEQKDDRSKKLINSLLNK